MDYDPSQFQAPHLSKDRIRQAADEFRDAYWTSPPPVDIEKIVEFGLKLDIVPVDGLIEVSSCDAFLCADLRTIRIDRRLYMSRKYECRVRFSLAHEVGHYVLHRNLVKRFSANTPEEWVDLQQGLPEKEYGSLEWQAYEFAGRLLVPRGYLVAELEQQRKSLNELYERMPEIDDEMVAEYVATPIAGRFHVSDDVIARRIKFEKLLPILRSPTGTP